MAKTKKTLINALNVVFFLTIVGIGSAGNVFASDVEVWFEKGLSTSLLGFLVGDYKMAASLYRKACDNGDARECAILGDMYCKGLGVKRNYTKAVSLYKKACDGGYTLGCIALGLMYEKGLGVKRNYTKAVSLYKKACDNDDARGCAVFYKKACDSGNAEGCNNLGVLYARGLLGAIERDYTKAASLYRKACNGRSAEGCNNLGFLYVKGKGVPLNKIKAYQYWMKAARLGSTEAQHNLDILCKESPWACK